MPDGSASPDTPLKARLSVVLMADGVTVAATEDAAIWCNTLGRILLQAHKAANSESYSGAVVHPE